MSPPAVHFGAGALGRGLVVPRLAAAGWSVTLVDADRRLVDELARRRSYPLVVTDGAGTKTREVPIAGASTPGDAAVAKLLSEATLVTTAVRRENLHRVAASLVAAWTGAGMPDRVAVVGCENVERVDDVLRAAFAAAGISAEQDARLVVPRTVVDRICAADWPSGLGVTTEPFNELAMAAAPGIAGIDPVDDIDGRFARKRYLVNAFADASAFLGAERGHRTLAEAIADRDIQSEITPLLAALRLHLELAYGYTAGSLEAYLAQSRERLANPAIPRLVETVARGFWRKLAPGERFAEPAIDLEERGLLGDGAVHVLAALVRAAAPGATSTREAHQGAPLSDAGARFFARLDAALAEGFPASPARAP